jgi:GNAT superfamily N-acetyltransferase
MPITIRPAMPNDAAIIADFNSRIAVETEDKTLDPRLINPGVARILADPSLGRYWLAEVDNVIAGQIMITYEWSDWRNGMMFWIQSVYVRAEFRRQGVFSALYRHVETLARDDAEVAGIRLYVEKDNHRAQRTYEKLGMSLTDYRIMQVRVASGKDSAIAPREPESD